MRRERVKEEAVFLGYILLGLFFLFMMYSVTSSVDADTLRSGMPPTECFEHEGSEVCYQSWRVMGFDTGVPLVVLVRPVSVFEPREELGGFETLVLAWRD